LVTSLWLANPRTIPTDAFEPGAHYDEIIVGGGITGLVAALLFAREGRRVLVVEAREIGAVTTGNTTAKVSQLQGTQLSKIKRYNYQAIVQAYADGQREAFDWLIDYAADHAVNVERRGFASR
jgi:glycine/D-amino acid oxidase-like deaminating enzyme